MLLVGKGGAGPMQSDESRPAPSPAPVLRLLRAIAGKSVFEHMPANERQVLQYAQGSDQALANESISCLLCYYQPKVVSFIGKKLPDAAAALDVWQQTSYRATRRLRRPPPLEMASGKNFGQYLYTIARNATNDALGVAAVQDAASLDHLIDINSQAIQHRPSVYSEQDGGYVEDVCVELLPQNVREICLGVTIPTHGEVRSDELARYHQRYGRSPVVRALAQLPEKHRACVILKDWFGVDFRTIGEALDIKENTAAFNAYSGRERMRAILACEWWEEDGYSLAYIAEQLNISASDVPAYIQKGQRLYERSHER